MVDVRGDVLRPPHGTTPAAVKSNKNQKCHFSRYRSPLSPNAKKKNTFGTKKQQHYLAKTSGEKKSPLKKSAPKNAT